MQTISTISLLLALVASPILAAPMTDTSIQTVGTVTTVSFDAMFEEEDAATAVLAACTGTDLSGTMFYVDETAANVGQCCT
jgi:uncharacterized protein YchJ